MKSKILSNAKINLGLNILGKRDDGYHNLEMIMAPIDLYDEMEIDYLEEAGSILIESNNSKIPTDKNNIIYKVYEEFFKKTSINKERINVFLNKNIPFAAGLGGGSGNGASFLINLNTHYGMPLSIEEMIEMSKKIGADIPFFIINKSSIVSGIGEKIEPFENICDCKILLIKPKFGISTKFAYDSYKELKNIKFAELSLIKRGMEENNLEMISGSIENTLQQALLVTSKEICDFETKLKSITDTKFFMSGSGSCYFTLVKTEAEELFNLLKMRMKDSFVSLNNFIK